MSPFMGKLSAAIGDGSRVRGCLTPRAGARGSRACWGASGTMPELSSVDAFVKNARLCEGDRYTPMQSSWQ